MLRIYKAILVVVMLGGISVKAQNRASCILGDTIHLDFAHDRGEVIWQQSVNNATWFVVPGLTTSAISFVPSTTPNYVRGVLDEDNCPLLVKVSFALNAIDTSSSSYAPEIYHFGQLPISLISEEEGQYTVSLNAATIPIQAGDYLGGIEGQANLLFVDAVIVQDGIARIFYSSTQLDTNVIPLMFGYAVEGIVMGRVLNEQGSPIALATVKIGDEQRLSNTDGVFVFESAPILERLGFIEVTKTGYLKGAKTFIPKSNGSNVELRLTQSVGSPSVFESGSGGQVTNGGLVIDFPDSAYNYSGFPFNSTVSVYTQLFQPNSEHFITTIQGNLIGNKENRLQSLKSFGQLRITLGGGIQVNSDRFISVKIPLSMDLAPLAPDTIDVWAFNDHDGLWESIGIALKNGNSYETVVPHHPYLNFATSSDAIFLQLTCSDEASSPISSLELTISESEFVVGADCSNPSGEFSVIIPQNTSCNFNLNYACGQTGSYTLLNDAQLGPFSNDTLLSFSNLPTTGLVKVRGVAEDCDGDLPSIAYLISDSVFSFMSNGAINYMTCATSDSVLIVNPLPLYSSGWQILPFSGELNDIGTINLCQSQLFNSDTLVDIEGNVYRTVLIGDQWWMAENLRVTHFSEGSLIPNISDTFDWLSATSSAICSNITGSVYSVYPEYYYNGYVISDSRQVCPVGWHVPTSDEWTVLIDFLGGEYVAGGKLKTRVGWFSPNVSSTNESGFSALPIGYCDTPNTLSFGGSANFATSDALQSFSMIDMSYFTPYIFVTPTPNQTGLSIRCLKD